jgi:3-oxoacyl-[acyl-carrier-protein] synthase II
MLIGAVEEFSPHRAWHTRRSGARRAVNGSVGATGEGAAVFVVERAAAPRRPGTAPAAQVLGTATGFGWGEAAGAALAGCVRRVLRDSAASADAVSLVLTGEAGDDDHSEYDAAVSALGHAPERLAVSQLLGECDAATGALAMGTLLALCRAEPDRAGALTVLTARTPDGGVGAALVQGCP